MSAVGTSAQQAAAQFRVKNPGILRKLSLVDEELTSDAVAAYRDQCDCGILSMDTEDENEEEEQPHCHDYTDDQTFTLSRPEEYPNETEPFDY
jgi:hypothetical protein